MKKPSLLLLPAIAAVLAACNAPAPASSTVSSEPVSSEPTSSEATSSEATSSEATSSSEASVSSVVSSTTPRKEGPFVTEPTTISFWHTFSDKYVPTLTSITEDFMKTEPNVTVNLVHQQTGYDGLLDMVIEGFPANNYPDMFVAYPDSVQMAIKYNKALDMQPYMDNYDYGWTKADYEDIIPAYVEEGKSYSIEGSFSLPFCKSTEAMYYNATVLLGLDLRSVDPTINEGNPLTEDYINNITWEELFGKLCPAIVAYNDLQPGDKKILKDDQTYHGVIGYDSDSNWFITLAEQYGYPYTSIDQITGEGSLDFVNDDMKGLMKVLHNAYQHGYVQSQGTSGTYTSGPFTKQNLLFCIGSTAGYTNQISTSFDTKVAAIPHAANGKKAVISQGPSIAPLDHGDENRALATWLYNRFLTNKENGAVWSLNSGYLPLRYSTYDSDEFADAMDTEGHPARSTELLLAESLTYCQTVGGDLYTSPVFTGSATARKQVGSLLTAAMTTTELTDDKLNELFDTAKSNTLKDM